MLEPDVQWKSVQLVIVLSDIARIETSENLRKNLRESGIFEDILGKFRIIQDIPGCSLKSCGNLEAKRLGRFIPMFDENPSQLVKVLSDIVFTEASERLYEAFERLLRLPADTTRT